MASAWEKRTPYSREYQYRPQPLFREKRLRSDGQTRLKIKTHKGYPHPIYSWKAGGRPALWSIRLRHTRFPSSEIARAGGWVRPDFCVCRPISTFPSLRSAILLEKNERASGGLLPLLADRVPVAEPPHCHYRRRSADSRDRLRRLADRSQCLPRAALLHPHAAAGGARQTRGNRHSGLGLHVPAGGFEPFRLGERRRAAAGYHIYRLPGRGFAGTGSRSTQENRRGLRPCTGGAGPPARRLRAAVPRPGGGEPFLAQVWGSSYGPPGAMDLSVVIFDSSEQLRNREEVSLEALATGARVIMGGFWHEIRNLCTAMRLSVTSLQQRPGMADAEEVEGLRSLMNGLERLTASGLRPESPQTFDVASLRAILDHLRIVIEPWFQESQMTGRWHEPTDLLLIRADHHGLLQVCLNLARNAHRALQRSERKDFTISSTVEGGQVFLRFHNTVPPLADPGSLFRPFQPAAAGSGLGLYVSRAIVRSFGGNLRYEPVKDGCCFAVVLERADLPFIVYGEKAGEEDPRVAS